MKNVKLKAALDDFEEESKKTGLKCLDKTLAQQQFAEECDINTIVDRFHLTGEIPQLTDVPTFQAFEGIFDFQSAMNTVRQANETFMSMPANLRARFHNDPQEFLTFTSNKDNLPELEKLGLLAPEAVERLNKERQAAENAKRAQIIEEHEKNRDKPVKDTPSPKGKQ